MRYIAAQGETIAEMREHARASDLHQHGDMKLVWVNEGDLCLMEFQKAFAGQQEPLGVDLGELSELYET